MKSVCFTSCCAALVALVVSLYVVPELRPEQSVPIVVEESFDPRPEQRVLDLPEDGNAWHTILIVRPEWRSIAAERKAEAMFHSEPLLISLKHQTHWHLITTDQAEFAKFRTLVAATPCLIVERANGEVVYRESGPELGKHPHNLTHVLRREIERHCPDGRCLPLHPVPNKDEPRQDDEVPAVLREDPKPAGPKAGGLVAVLTALGAAAGGVGWQWKKTG
ncbi:MAG: hypothetical protein HY290_33490 [Planctomycetia bacterium]|nr:hypothetical protein [Planctomycetia bacterium]